MPEGVAFVSRSYEVGQALPRLRRIYWFSEARALIPDIACSRVEPVPAFTGNEPGQIQHSTCRARTPRAG